MITTIVFDLGNVLIAWAPLEAFRSHFGTDDAAAEAWLEAVGFQAWNLARDAGLSEAEALAAIANPDDRARLALYRPNFAATIAHPVPGTWEIAEALKARGHALHAITNWAADTFPEARRLYPRLETLFGEIVVSGEEKLLKPEAEIYARLCQRANVAPEECLFIDDGLKNVLGARAAGMEAHHFTDAAALRADLEARGLI